MNGLQELCESPEKIPKIVCVYFSGDVSFPLVSILFSSGSLTPKLNITIKQIDVCIWVCLGFLFFHLESANDVSWEFTLNITGNGPLSFDQAPFLSCYPCSLLHVGPRSFSMADANTMPNHSSYSGPASPVYARAV